VLRPFIHGRTEGTSAALGFKSISAETRGDIVTVRVCVALTFFDVHAMSASINVANATRIAVNDMPCRMDPPVQDWCRTIRGERFRPANGRKQTTSNVETLSDGQR
jgi:hypothetical protein